MPAKRHKKEPRIPVLHHLTTLGITVRLVSRTQNGEGFIMFRHVQRAARIWLAGMTI